MISILIVFILIVPWYIYLLTHTSEHNLIYTYKAHIYFSLFSSKILFWIDVIALLFEFGAIKKFNSIFYLTLSFFSVSFIFGILYQIITCRLAIFQWDAEAKLITHQFYIWSSMILILGFSMVIIHIVRTKILMFSKNR